MLRSGPFSDERIVGLLNARFVPFYFDLGKGSPAGDEAARAFVVAAKAELGGSSVPTPPVMLMTAEGELVAEVSNYASEEQMVGALRAVLAEHPEYAEPGSDESALGRLERARLAHWLGDDDAARAHLDGDRTPEESLFLAQVARRAGDVERACAALNELDTDLHDADLALECGLLAWMDGEYSQMLAALDTYPQDGPRAAEARYHLGLAQFHSGEPAEARATWRALVEEFGENRWSYRADWAYSQTTETGTAERKSSFTTTGPKSLLGRHGYMGRQNPDLSPR